MVALRDHPHWSASGSARAPWDRVFVRARVTSSFAARLLPDMRLLLKARVGCVAQASRAHRSASARLLGVAGRRFAAGVRNVRAGAGPSNARVRVGVWPARVRSVGSGASASGASPPWSALSAAASSAATASTAGWAGWAGCRSPTVTACTDGDRGQEFHRVLVTLRAGGRSSGLRHRAVDLEGVAAGAAPEFVSRHPPRVGPASVIRCNAVAWLWTTLIEHDP